MNPPQEIREQLGKAIRDAFITIIIEHGAAIECYDFRELADQIVEVYRDPYAYIESQETGLTEKVYKEYQKQYPELSYKPGAHAVKYPSLARKIPKDTAAWDAKYAVEYRMLARRVPRGMAIAWYLEQEARAMLHKDSGLSELDKEIRILPATNTIMELLAVQCDDCGQHTNDECLCVVCKKQVCLSCKQKDFGGWFCSVCLKTLGK